MAPEIIYVKGRNGTIGYQGESIHYVNSPGSPAQKIWSHASGTKDSSDQVGKSLIQQIAVSRPSIQSELIVYYLWGMIDDPDSGKQIRKLDLAREWTPPKDPNEAVDPGDPFYTYHPLRASDGGSTEISPVPDATRSYDKNKHLKFVWIRDLQIRYTAGSGVIFFTGFFDEDDCMPGHPCQDPDHQPHETVTEFTTIYYLDENRTAIPYHTIKGSELPIPCPEGEHWLQWNGIFAFNNNDLLYVCTGNSPDRIFEIVGAGSQQVTGTPSTILDFPDAIKSMAGYGPGILYFLSQNQAQGWVLSRLDLISLVVETVHDSQQDPEFTNVVDFCIVPSTESSHEGLQVEWVQRALSKILGIVLQVDGIYGPTTKNAVKEFQDKYGLVSDGIVGPRTKAMILEIISEIRG